MRSAQDPPPDLPRLRTLRSGHAMWVDRLDEAIEAAERREAERVRGEQARPAVYVHAGHCDMMPKPPRAKGITVDQARRALHERVDACPHCRPDTELGMLEWSDQRHLRRIGVVLRVDAVNVLVVLATLVLFAVIGVRAVEQPLNELE
ncbi:DUF6233 domain-containing protein [Streptomyces sp. NPDC058644]|uniref:DUF6233 domain-containing protein n=1 Tax=unclassified Streptomyces TaxID=2593676 RepID=UPI00364B2261